MTIVWDVRVEDESYRGESWRFLISAENAAKAEAEGLRLAKADALPPLKGEKKRCLFVRSMELLGELANVLG